MLRGLDKVKVEWGLIALAHNMKKLWSLISKSTKELMKKVSFLIFCKTIRELLKSTIKHHYQKIKSDPNIQSLDLLLGQPLLFNTICPELSIFLSLLTHLLQIL